MQFTAGIMSDMQCGRTFYAFQICDHDELSRVTSPNVSNGNIQHAPFMAGACRNRAQSNLGYSNKQDMLQT